MTRKSTTPAAVTVTPAAAPGSGARLATATTSGDLHVITYSAAGPVTHARLADVIAARGATALAARITDATSPVAALGVAVRAAAEPGHKWVHTRTHKHSSRWVYTQADVDPARVRIEGYDGATAEADGTLRVDAGVPAGVADRLRAAYDAARGVVDPSRVNAGLTRLIESPDVRGAALRECVYLVDGLHGDVKAALDVIADLGGLAVALRVDAAAAPSFAQPVQRAVEDEVREAVKVAAALVDKARAAREGGPALREREPGDTAAAQALREARERLRLWRSRLGLAMGDLDRTILDASHALVAELRATADAAAAAAEGRAYTPPALPALPTMPSSTAPAAAPTVAVDVAPDGPVDEAARARRAARLAARGKPAAAE